MTKKGKKGLYGLICFYNIGKIVLQYGGITMEKFSAWITTVLETYGESVLTFVVVAFAIGLATETLKRAVFSALDKKFPESEKVATAKTVFAITIAIALEAFLFSKPLERGTWVGGENAHAAWFVLMFYAQMGADLKAIKRIWNWILMKANAPKVEKEQKPKMKTIVVAEVNPNTGILEYKEKLVPRDTRVERAR